MITICEVGPRDGLQNESDVLPPKTRAELVNQLAAAGLPRRRGGQLRQRRARAADGGSRGGRRRDRAARRHDLRRSRAQRAGLRPAARGRARRGALRGRGDRELQPAQRERFGRGGGSRSEQVLARAREDGLRSTATISVAFGCPFEGRVDPETVVDLAERLRGADEVVLADTIGVATPGQVRGTRRGVAKPVGFHLHNTRNTGFANAYAALEGGATTLDSSIGGLGGCPFAPRATGNIATEDLVYMLEGDGVETGVDLDALIAISEWLEGVLGRPLEGQLYRAGDFPYRSARST